MNVKVAMRNKMLEVLNDPKYLKAAQAVSAQMQGTDLKNNMSCADRVEYFMNVKENVLQGDVKGYRPLGKVTYPPHFQEYLKVAGIELDLENEAPGSITGKLMGPIMTNYEKYAADVAQAVANLKGGSEEDKQKMKELFTKAAADDVSMQQARKANLLRLSSSVKFAPGQGNEQVPQDMKAADSVGGMLMSPDTIASPQPEDDEEEVMSATTDEEYTVYYWGACKKFWGRAIGPILTLDKAGVKYTVKEPTEAAPNSGVAWPQVGLPSGEQIAQTPAILDVLGDEFGLAGRTRKQRRLCRQMVMDMNDVFGEAVGGKFALVDGKPNDRMAKWMDYMTIRLKASKFLCGDEPTVADYQGVFAFVWMLKKAENCEAVLAKNYPVVAKWWTALKATPECDRLFKSGIPMIP